MLKKYKAYVIWDIFFSKVWRSYWLIKLLISIVNDYQFQTIKTELPEYDYQIAFLSIQELAYLIKNKILSSERLTRIYIDRIKKFDTKLNSVVNLMEDVAIEQSLRADNEIERGIYRGILHGIPYGIKDIASYPSYPTTWGTEPYKNRIINEINLAII